MISDVLTDAMNKSKEYLDDPAFAGAYSGKLRDDIQRVLEQMEKLRAELDLPPAGDGTDALQRVDANRPGSLRERRDGKRAGK